VVRERRRKRRSDLLEGYLGGGNGRIISTAVRCSPYAEGAAYSENERKRVSEDLQDQLYTALETILERGTNPL